MGPRASTPDTGATAWSALAGEFVAERERWFLWLPVLLGTGIALYFGLRIEPPPWTGGAWLAFATLFLIAARHRPAWRIVAIAAIAVGLGFAMAQWRSHDVAAPVLTGEIGPATTSGRIVEVQAREHGVRLLFDHATISGLDVGATPKRVRITVRTERGGVRVGDWGRLRARQHPAPSTSPAGLGSSASVRSVMR